MFGFFKTKLTQKNYGRNQILKTAAILTGLLLIFLPLGIKIKQNLLLAQTSSGGANGPYFVCLNQPTPTGSIAASPTRSPSLTVTPINTLTPTKTPTRTPTPVLSLTPTRTPTPTAVVTGGNNYYVSVSSCSDTGPGTLSQPFCTITKGVSVMISGDVLNVRSGTYSSFSVTKAGSSGKLLNLQAYAGEHPVISGGSNGILISGSYVRVSGFEVKGATGSYGAGILISGVNNSVAENNLVHDNLGTKTHGIIVSNGSNNTVSNNTVYNNYSVGIKVQGTGTGNRLIGNRSFGNIGDPPNSDGIAVTDQTTQTLVQNNIVHNNGDDGIDTWSSSHNTIIGNISYSNGVPGGDGNGFKMGGTSTGGSNRIVQNISYNNNRDGFDSNHSGNNTYINNVAYNNASVGYQDGEGKLSPCTVSTCKTTYINNIGYDNLGVNFNAGDFTAVSHNNLWFLNSGNPGVSYNGVTQSSLLAFYLTSGNRLDNPSAGTLSSLQANPLFVNPAGGNFSLSSSSPAINKGDPTNPGNIVAVGVPDIGAVEFGL